MSKWTVKMTAKCEAEFKSSLKKKDISAIDVGVIKAWLTEMEQFGPKFIEASKRWSDHPLHSEWQGYRASCYSMLGRIIYKVEGMKVIVEVARVTPTHDYKK